MKYKTYLFIRNNFDSFTFPGPFKKHYHQQILLVSFQRPQSLTAPHLGIFSPPSHWQMLVQSYEMVLQYPFSHCGLRLEVLKLSLELGLNFCRCELNIDRR